MLVFIDDSGDAGFKIEKGSSKFFVIAAVVFHDDLEAEKTAVAIKELRRKLGYQDWVEFKFNKSSKKIRQEFLEAIKGYNFKVRCVVVDKNLIYSAELRNRKESFYSYMIKMLLKHNHNTIVDARIKIDGSGDRIFRRMFLTYLRKHLNTHQCKVIKNCKLVDSKSNVLIQLADMVAGSIRRFYDESKSDKDLYKSIILEKIEDEWKFK